MMHSAQSLSRSELRAQVGRQLSRLDASLRLIAEDVMGLAAPIDLICADASGRIVLVVITEGEGCGALLTRGLAQRAWLAPRLKDWLKLAPDLGVRPDAPIRVVLVAREFDAETRTAAASLSPGAVVLTRYRRPDRHDPESILLDLESGLLVTWDAEPDASESKSIPPFRSGLSDRDLDLSSSERDALD